MKDKILEYLRIKYFQFICKHRHKVLMDVNYDKDEVTYICAYCCKTIKRKR